MVIKMLYSQLNPKIKCAEAHKSRLFDTYVKSEMEMSTRRL